MLIFLGRGQSLYWARSDYCCRWPVDESRSIEA